MAARRLLPFLFLSVGLSGFTAPQGWADPPVRRVPLVERWRLTEESEVMVGRVVDAAVDATGRVHLVDEQLGRVLVIRPDGTLDRTVGRPGEGPGELRQPTGMLWLGDGLLGVIDGRPGEISVFSPDGGHRGPFLLRDEQGAAIRSRRLLNARARGGSMAVTFRDRVVEDGRRRERQVLAFVDPETGRDGPFVLVGHRGWDFATRTYDEAAEYFVYPARWDLGPDGSAYVATARNAYRIDVFAPDGGLLRSLGRDFTPPARSAADRERLAAARTMMIGGERVRLASTLEDHAPCVEALKVDEEGRLWVQHAGSLATGNGTCSVDVFGDGSWDGIVTYGTSLDLERNRVMWLDVGAYLVLLGEPPLGVPADPETEGEPLVLVYLTAN